MASLPRCGWGSPCVDCPGRRLVGRCLEDAGGAGQPDQPGPTGLLAIAFHLFNLVPDASPTPSTVDVALMFSLVVAVPGFIRAH